MTKDKKDLTIKQRKWLKIYLKTGNATKAAMEVYNCKDHVSAASVGYETLRKLQLYEVMEEAGLSDAELLRVHREGLAASRTVSAVNPDKNAKADSVDFIDVPDYTARYKYLELAWKLKGKILSGSQLNNQINIGEAMPIMDLPALAPGDENYEEKSRELDRRLGGIPPIMGGTADVDTKEVEVLPTIDEKELSDEELEEIIETNSGEIESGEGTEEEK